MGFFVQPEYDVQTREFAGEKPHTPAVLIVISGYRFYDPSLGRFINMDPIGENGGVNLYSMCNNEVIKNIDYLGRVAVSDVPWIQEQLGWSIGAKLQRRWFSGLFDSSPWAGDARNGNPWPNPDTTTIKMEWILGYQRAKDNYEKIVRNKIYMRSTAHSNIAKVIKKYDNSSGRSFQFGSFTKPFPELHNERINYQEGQGFSYRLDDLTAALGRFSFYVLIKGCAGTSSRSPNEYEVKISHFGIYVYDRFEFSVGNDDLGWWSTSPPSAKPYSYPGATQLKNEDYIRHRIEHQQGADFEIFSDVKRETATLYDTIHVRKQ